MRPLYMNCHPALDTPACRRQGIHI